MEEHISKKDLQVSSGPRAFRSFFSRFFSFQREFSFSNERVKCDKVFVFQSATRQQPIENQKKKKDHVSFKY